MISNRLPPAEIGTQNAHLDRNRIRRKRLAGRRRPIYRNTPRSTPGGSYMASVSQVKKGTLRPNIPVRVAKGSLQQCSSGARPDIC